MSSVISTRFRRGKLRAFLKKRGVSPAQAARALGISPAMLSRLLRGQRGPGLKTLLALSRVYPDAFD